MDIPLNQLHMKAETKFVFAIEPSFIIDRFCHSSLRCAVFERVALTSTEFCINPRKKVDHVCILVRH